MFIHKKFSIRIIQAAITILSAVALYFTFNELGVVAWRFFPTYVLIIAVLYFGVATFAGLIAPAMFGMVMMGFLLASFSALIMAIAGAERISGGPWAINYIILPVLVTMDWILCMKKGVWRANDPLTWLALPAAYAAGMVLTANVFPGIEMRYPLNFLNYREIGLPAFFGILGLYAAIILAVGYGFYVTDAALGGRLAKYILLPKIKTIEIDEKEKPALEKKPEVKAVARPIRRRKIQ